MAKAKKPDKLNRDGSNLVLIDTENFLKLGVSTSLLGAQVDEVASAIFLNEIHPPQTNGKADLKKHH